MRFPRHWLLLFIAFLLAGSPAIAGAKKRPNIIIIQETKQNHDHVLLHSQSA